MTRDQLSTSEVHPQQRIAVGALPVDVLGSLKRARVAYRAKVRLNPDHELRDEAEKAARVASAEAAMDEASLSALQALSDANAMMVVLASSGDLERFPKEVLTDALVPLANLCGSLAREHEASGDAETALERYLRGLQLLLTLQVHKPWYRVNRVARWLISRAGLTLGRLAASRHLDLHRTVEVFETNFGIFKSLVEDEEYANSRAFTVTSFARALLTEDVPVSNWKQLATDIEEFAAEGAPREKAGVRFHREVRAILSQLHLLSAEPSARSFRWA